MKNVSSIKANTKGESPKTPGGISKSLLTPCRRVGLSRNWKKAGKSPFISPIPGNSNDVDIIQDKTETRKRKERNCEEETESNEATPKSHIEKENRLDIKNDLGSSTDKNKDITGTPSRSIEIPRKKKSKTLISAINNSKENICDSNSKESDEPAKDDTEKQTTEDFPNKCVDDLKQLEDPVVAKDVKSSKRNKKLISPIKSNIKKRETKGDKDNDGIKEIVHVSMKENFNSEQQMENISPRKSPNLTKECIVVIQKNILKTDDKKSEHKIVDSTESNEINENNDSSQTLFDSDIDEVPLSHLNKKEKKTKAIDSDEDFSEATCKTKVKKLEDKNTPTGDLKGIRVKNKNNKKSTKTLAKATVQTVVESKQASQSSCSFDDDEDFEFDKRTILIRKSYNKVVKPVKAKSTGSITLKDIDELRAKIEIKKKLLLAKAISKDTEDIRGLIKKWQKGCQNALAELMDLMKSKYPDKQNMDYSEILQMLKIPPALVGYDSDNDCFVTPEDSNVILSNFND